ncbi:MAG: hypothetical protein AAF191_17900, partial [Verrucomicrobiota bacterium]
GTGNWFLHNLAEDPGETTNVAEAHPEIHASLIAAWGSYVASSGVIEIEESPPGGARKRVPAGYGRQLVVNVLDENLDMEITAAEIEKATMSLLRMDANQDGQITPDEYLAEALPKPPAPPKEKLVPPLTELVHSDEPELPAYDGDIHRVSPENQSGPWDGKTWQTAHGSLTDALAAATLGDQIWVQAGTYFASGRGERDKSIPLKEGVAVFGGFAGTESMLDERDWEANVTTLSGDIGKRGDHSDNTYHVVYGADDALLDGFVIRDGNGVSITRARGGGKGKGKGKGASEGGGNKENIHITPEVVLSGVNPGAGAGMVNFKASPIVRNCLFLNNQARKGGAVYNMVSEKKPDDPGYIYEKAPAFVNVTFQGNTAIGRGGAISNDLGTNPLFLRCSFLDNHCDGKGGAMYNDFNCSPILKNCLLVGNSAFNGGALGNDGDSDPLLVNCTLTRNHASDMGPSLYQGSGPDNAPIVINSIIWGNTCDHGPATVYNWHANRPEISFSCIEGGYPGEGNLSQDPLFTDPENGDFTLAAGSPCIDQGTGYQVPTTDRLDRRGFDDPGAPNGPMAQAVRSMTPLGETTDAGRPPVDIGAFERMIASPTLSQERIYVDSRSTAPEPDGVSWATAFSSLQEAIDLGFRSQGEIWVATGTYKPTASSLRTISFRLHPGVKLYGGFSSGSQTMDDRDWETNPTILSGDIGREGDASDNSYHVLIGADEALLDGFLITGGNANGESFDGQGGGMVNYARHPQKAPTRWATGYSPHLRNCIFRDNYAIQGGAVYNYDRGEPSYINVLFEDNRAVTGGAMLDRVGPKSTITNCVFRNNHSDWRGGAT